VTMLVFTLALIYAPTGMNGCNCCAQDQHIGAYLTKCRMRVTFAAPSRNNMDAPLTGCCGAQSRADAAGLSGGLLWE
jgi:hypothetical protein